MEKLHAMLIYNNTYGDWSYWDDYTSEEKSELIKELKRKGLIYHYGKGVYKWKNPVRVVYEVSDEYNEDGGYYEGEHWVISGDDSYLLEDYTQCPDDILYSDDGELGLPTLQELYTLTLSNGRVFDFHEWIVRGGRYGLKFCKPHGATFTRLYYLDIGGMLSDKTRFNEYYGARREWGLPSYITDAFSHR